MIKMIFCLRRREGMSLAEFQDYWFNRHAPLVKECAPDLRIRRYVQSHRTDIAELAAAPDARGCVQPPYDGVAELYWDSAEDVAAVGETKAGRDAGRRLLEDEHKFIDLANSPIFWVDAREII